MPDATKATKAQAKALKQLMLGEIEWMEVHGTVRKAIRANEWYDQSGDGITKEGMLAADIPFNEYPSITLTRPIVYQHPYRKGEKGELLHRTVRLEPNTQIVVTWRSKLEDSKYQSIVEGFALLKDESLFVRLYEPKRAIEGTITIPDINKMKRAA